MSCGTSFGHGPIKEEPQSQINPDPESHCSGDPLKQEPADWQDYPYSLYPGHVLKVEMVIEPDVLPQPISITPQTCEGVSASHLSSLQGEEMKKGEEIFTYGVNEGMFTNDDLLKSQLVNNDSEKPHACNICKQRFKRRSYLKKHLLNHTDEKPFKCNVCTKTFKRKAGLARHELIHSDEKPFSCDLCEKKFNDSSILKRHQLLHSTDFSCNICQKMCANRLELKSHLRGHREENPFICDICKKLFTGRRKLIRHLRTHRRIIGKLICSQVTFVNTSSERSRAKKAFKWSQKRETI